MSATTRTAHGSAQRVSMTTTNDVQAPAEPTYELVDLDRYAIMHDGPVHDFQTAVQTVIEHAASVRRTRRRA